jgi:hypothetical protein
MRIGIPQTSSTTEILAPVQRLGLFIGYSTVHPIFAPKVVQAVKDGGGKPFIAVVNWKVGDAQMRSYTTELLGWPVFPAAGPDEKRFYPHERRPYKNIQKWLVACAISAGITLSTYEPGKAVHLSLATFMTPT